MLFSSLLLLAIFVKIAGQSLDGAAEDSEGLKAQLLQNLNKYSAHGAPERGPMEPIGGREGDGRGKGSEMDRLGGGDHGKKQNTSPVPPALFQEWSQLLSNFFPPSSSSSLPPLPPPSSTISSSPLFIPDPSSVISSAGFPPLPMTPRAPFPADHPLDPIIPFRPSAERRYQASTACPPPLSSPTNQQPSSFPISRTDTKKTKAADEDKWGRTAGMIGEWRRRMYKLLKRHKSREKKEQPNGGEDEQEQSSPPLLVFGGPPSLIDTRKANKLAKLFGVESKRREGKVVVNPEKKGQQVHAAELRTGGREPGEAERALEQTQSEDEDEAEEGEEERGQPFEVVLLPALKRKKTGKMGQTRGSADGAEKEALPAPAVSATTTSTAPTSAAPPVPVSALASGPAPLLPLQFPTLLPPLSSFTLPSLPPFPPPPTLPNRSPEGDYLRELENVPEDYLDEQEHRVLPCVGTHSSAPSPSRQQPAGNCKSNKLKDPQMTPGQGPGGGGIFPTDDEEGEEGSNNSVLWEENREMCNSARLRTLIKESIVPQNVEKSKRLLQQRAEQHFGALFNVVCGTGFFSYIAHTDEFCLVAVQDLNCYVFSPVCSSRMSIASGIVRRQKHKTGRRRRNSPHYYSARHLRAYLNRN